MENDLEELLKPTKALDKEILREYTKLTKRWESRGRSRYSLAHAFQLPAILTTLLYIGISPYSNPRITEYLSGFELARNIMEPFYGNRDITNDGTIAESNNPVFSLYKIIAGVTRLPLFVFGVGLIAKGGFDLVDYIKTQNPDALHNVLIDFSLGYTLFGNASSMYVKESNPKLLDKEPAWKRAYSFLKSKLEGGLQPAPQPIPETAGTGRYG